jgi:hypothetical protein
MYKKKLRKVHLVLVALGMLLLLFNHYISFIIMMIFVLDKMNVDYLMKNAHQRSGADRGKCVE